MDGPEAVSGAGWATADLSDEHPDSVSAVVCPLLDFGGLRKFAGKIATLKVFEDYRPVYEALQQPGQGCVLVVDAGGSRDCAVLGERLLNMAARNGWAGAVIYGVVRDTALTREVAIGLRALGTIPRRGESGLPCIANQPVTFGEVTFTPGDRLWADEDGIVVGTSEKVSG
ncbi:MAG: ribonuclease E activity regulator RraA [Gemmatimonadales bacterium]